MNLGISSVSRGRGLRKAMSRIYADIKSLASSIADVEMLSPLQTETLILITDENDPGTLKEIKNNEGIFQVVAGCPKGLSDHDLKKEVSKIIRATFTASRFSVPDHVALINVIKSWEKKQLIGDDQ